MAAPWVRVLLAERERRSSPWMPVAGDKEADARSKQRAGAHMHPRAHPTQGSSP